MAMRGRMEADPGVLVVMVVPIHEDPEMRTGVSGALRLRSRCDAAQRTDQNGRACFRIGYRNSRRQ